ncbi:hypothetical protein UFOVP119_34 [uncultured Caudovirales phage]|uniref:DUF7694 domain-containing protein n=1 Tax=uncultured Caudovirales phage TaxID=2100421 RepID=A0A6J5LBV9_9CAUD|nr:hypothetical protein UFOVP119_34 [uncultured Caudovirales phage]
MMRCPPQLACYRRSVRGEYGDGRNGYMMIPARGLAIMFSSGAGWEHVSVSLADRCPTWDELEWVKRQFWEPGDTVMQLHVPVSEHRCVHPFCLHLWRPLGAEIPRPPAYMVG